MPLMVESKGQVGGNLLARAKGSLVSTANMVLRQPNLLEMRRGLPRSGAAISSGYITRLFPYTSSLVAFDGSNTLYSTSDLGATWNTLSGSFSPISAVNPIRAAEAQQNLYFTCTAGVQRVDAITAAPTNAGALPGLDLNATLVSGSSGWMAANSQAAYRVLWGIKDANGNVITGPPSGRTTVVNPALTAAAGTLARNAANNGRVNVTASGGYTFTSGQSIIVGPGETNFSAGQFTLTTIDGTHFYYDDGVTSIGSTPSSVLPQVITNTTLNTFVDTTIPAGATTSNFCQFYRTVASAAASIPPDDEMQLVYEASPPSNVVTGVNSITRPFASVVVTVTTATPHPYVVGQQIYLQTNTAAFPSGIKTVVTVADTTHFTYNEAGSNTTESSKTFSAVTLVLNGSASAAAPTDNLAESLMGQTLYTSPSQEGPDQANFPPPVSWDLALLNDTMFYANSTAKQRKALSLLSADSPSGIAAGDTLTLDGIVFTAGSGLTSESPSTNTFGVDTSTLNSGSQRTLNTCLSLIRVVNRSLTSTVYATYTAGPNDPPGAMLFERRAFGGSTFTIAASAHGATAWNPPIASAISSSAEAHKNYLYYSKPNQPDAVPLFNYLAVGAANKNILRIMATRDSLFVFKEDGLFRVTGKAAPFTVVAFDLATVLVAPESLARLSGALFCLARNGVIAVSETGVSLVSTDIQDSYRVYAALGSSVAQYCFGWAYESEGEYCIAPPGFTVVAVPPMTFSQATSWDTYNAVTGGWTTGSTIKDVGSNSASVLNCAVVDPSTNKLIIGGTSSSTGRKLRVENKAMSYGDFADDSFAITVSSITNNATAATSQLTLVSSTNIAAGDYVYVSNSHRAVVLSNDGSNKITVASGTFGATGAGICYKAYSASIAYAPFLGDPGESRFTEMTLMCGWLVADSKIDTISFVTEQPVSIPSQTFDSGRDLGFSDSNAGPHNVKIQIPVEGARAQRLTVTYTHTRAWAAFQINGIFEGLNRLVK